MKGQGVHGKSLYLLLYFAVNLKQLHKTETIKKGILEPTPSIPVLMSWTIKKAEHPRIDVFELCCWRRLLRVPWIARRSNKSIQKEINPEYFIERIDAEGSILWPLDARDTRDIGSIPGLGRSPGGGRGNPLQYSCLENSMDREAWRATVHGGSQRVRQD